MINYKILRNEDLKSGELKYRQTEDNQVPQLFDDNTVTVSKKEILQKYEYTCHITFPSLTYNIAYKPMSADNLTIGILIPGAQNVSAYTDAVIGGSINFLGQKYSNLIDANKTKWSTGILQPTIAYPCMLLG